MKIEPGEIVIAVMHSPREKLIGILESIEPAGVTLRAIDLGYFDDWCRSIAAGEEHLTMTDYFFPMWRVERITLDTASASIPSMWQQFETRTGLRLAEQ